MFSTVAGTSKIPLVECTNSVNAVGGGSSAGPAAGESCNRLRKLKNVSAHEAERLAAAQSTGGASTALLEPKSGSSMVAGSNAGSSSSNAGGGGSSNTGGGSGAIVLASGTQEVQGGQQVSHV